MEIQKNFGPIVGTCDKCKGDVVLGNSALHLDFQRALMKGDLTRAAGLCVASDRHIAPVGNCEGSPSRWQYFFGSPPSERYPLKKELIESFHIAYSAQLKSKQ